MAQEQMEKETQGQQANPGLSSIFVCSSLRNKKWPFRTVYVCVCVWLIVVSENGGDARYCVCQVGKVKKTKEDKPSEDGVGMNVKSIVVVALMMILLLFAVHCTWVTSNAYSSPSIVLASYGHDG